MVLQNKVILVTGGTGSFGQKFTEIALREHDPKVIRIFSRGELDGYVDGQAITRFRQLLK